MECERPSSTLTDRLAASRTPRSASRPGRRRRTRSNPLRRDAPAVRMNPRAASQASLVGRVHVIPALDLEGEVLDTDVVVAVGAAVGRAQTDPSAIVRVNQVDDLLGAAVGGIAD